jgi:hypothetical protein
VFFADFLFSRCKIGYLFVYTGGSKRTSPGRGHSALSVTCARMAATTCVCLAMEKEGIKEQHTNKSINERRNEENDI